MSLLSKSLVLNRYLLSHFGVNGFESLSEALNGTEYEGRDINNVSHIYHELRQRLFTTDKLNETQILEYDANIFSHTQRINEKRKDPIKWKYFQYLSLLFTEIYLDKFFTNRAVLLSDLNEYLDAWNDPENTHVTSDLEVPIEPFQHKDLNKLAFWNATGSGKTLIMHVNILQYEYWRKKRKDQPKNKINKIVLVTPNEGLSQQHLKEFEASNLPANIFSRKSGTVFSGQEIEIIEISKLAEESKIKTVDYQSFETNNLVLIDEGHRGIAGNVIKDRRDYLSEDGFAFEYSATFGQAVAAASTVAQRESLVNEYGKIILFDYSYKYFHKDGFGKDYHILNLAEDGDDVFVKKYLTGALLSFYQQKVIFYDKKDTIKPFNIEDPLWIFVGGTVNKTVNKTVKADIPLIMEFFQWFIADKRQAKEYLRALLDGRDGILDEQNRSIFNHFFSYVRSRQFNEEQLYQDILEKVFNATQTGATLYLDNLNGIEGELGLRIGDNDYFGVVNIGDDNKLFKYCQELGFLGDSKDFSRSLFQDINEYGSKVNVLIGAKKFTEGWSSWRVSTMGLMKVGQSEGSQIIQLFGRGVRLKGWNMSLKRSTAVAESNDRPDFKIPKELQELEKLNIFGIKAEYMQNFKTILDEEDVPANDSTYEEISVSMLPQVRLDERKLKILTVREGIDFKKDQKVTLNKLYSGLLRTVVLDWYPKVQVLHAAKNINQGLVEENTRGVVGKEHIAFINWDTVWLELQQFKNEQSWYNLSIPKDVLVSIILDDSWYELYIPEGEQNVNSFQKVNLWQEIVTALLKEYVKRCYNYHKSDYLSRHMKTEVLTPDHPNFEEKYQILIEESEKRIIENVKELAQLMENRAFKENLDLDTSNQFKAFNFLRHLYKPLLYMDERKYRDIIKISPIALNKGEWQFVNDLKAYFNQHEYTLEGKQLCLLRNQSRKGVGFFDAHGFYPDFILWLLEDDKQHIAFVDPKGLRQINGFDHPKMRFYKTIKEEIQSRLEDKDVNLNSFVTTRTPHADVRHWSGGELVSKFNDKHIYFMQEQRSSYIEAVLGKMVQ